MLTSEVESRLPPEVRDEEATDGHRNGGTERRRCKHFHDLIIHIPTKNTNVKMGPSLVQTIIIS